MPIGQVNRKMYTFTFLSRFTFTFLVTVLFEQIATLLQSSEVPLILTDDIADGSVRSDPDALCSNLLP